MHELIFPVLSLLDGLICILLAVFAHEFGLDPTTTWGSKRFVLLTLGMALGCISLYWIYTSGKRHDLPQVFKSETIKTFYALFHLWGILFLVYAWFITFGHFTTWSHTSHYYTQLADAFARGQLHIELEPGRALSEAADPYHPTDRPPFSDEVWDMSLYKGKLYLYWGPVPALLITPIQMILGRKITDNFLVFFFFAGLLMINSLIIVKLRKQFFPGISAANMFVCVGLIGLILPISWSLNIPNVYEAAIGAGHFFLIGGIYFILSAIEQDSFFNKRSLVFAGTFLACSVGSRAINVFSVIFLAACTSFWIAGKFARPFQWTRYIQTISALYIPLIVGAVMIGWYNWARFDSPLEFGLRYQITIFNLNKDMNLVFQSGYFPLNLYAYLFQPFEVIPEFPFIQPIIISTTLDKFGVLPPHLYAAGRVSGLLICAPFLVFSLVPLFSRRQGVRWKEAFTGLQKNGFVTGLLAGSFLINFLCILFYFFGQLRFLVDVISQITLLAITGYWRLLSVGREPASRQPRVIVVLGNFLIIFTLCTSILIALTSETNRMGTLNPALFEEINSMLLIPK